MNKKTKKVKPSSVFGQRIDIEIQDAVRDLCKKEGYSLQGFFKNALLRELEYQRSFEVNMIWKTVKGYEGIYSVSENGDIRRETRGDNTYKGRILTQYPDSRGYLQVSLCNGNKLTKYVHILVAQAFIGIRPKGMTINHKDTKKKNNRYLNLEYITNMDNIQHACKHGIKFGPTSNTAQARKLNRDEVNEIRKIYKEGNVTQKVLGIRFKVTRENISSIIRWETWR